MASSQPDSVINTPGSVSPIATPEPLPLEQPPKRKSGRRLLQSLQRISSSPSLVRRSRSCSNGYHRDGKPSLSCVSLSSAAYGPSCLGEPGPPQLVGRLQERASSPNEPPLSAAATAGVGENTRIRVLGALPNVSQTTVPLPAELRPTSRMGLPAMENGTVNTGPTTVTTAPVPKRKVDFWKDMPIEIKMEIFRKLSPTEIVRCSRVSKEWYRMCFDGQLWSSIDATDYYSQISGDALIKIITSGGPFIRDLNLRGCVQLLEKWVAAAERLSDACRNIVSFTLEGCRVDKTALHYFLHRNPRLEFINVSGLSSVSNSAMRIIAQSCPYLETLIVSWCSNVDTKGLRRVVESCHRLKELRAGEIRGFDDEGFMAELFKRNTLERLVVHRTDITDQSLKVLIHGFDPEVDLLTDRPIVPPRNLKHLDLHQCSALTDDGVCILAHNLPLLRGLQLSQCPELTDDSIVPVIQTTPLLTHLDLEELENLTNNTLIELSKSPCVDTLEHLNVSSCENLGDSGMLPVLRNCAGLLTVVMDNTRISDLCLSDASNRIRKRGYDHGLPRVGLRLVVFDCVNVTWAGIKEVLSNNAHPPRALKNATSVVTAKAHSPADACRLSPATTPSVTSSPMPQPAKMFPKEIIELKCFYGWQMTVDEHTKRVLRGDLAAAARLDRKWAEYMMATEEAGVGGAGARRRRRRAREAERLYNDDEEDGDGSGGVGPLGGRRRRARSGGCVVM